MKNTIRGILIVALIILNIPGITKAQAGDSSAAKNLHTFNLYLINGYALSYNFCNTDKFYLRAALDFSTYKSDMDNDRKSSYGAIPTDNNTIERNSINENFSVGFSAQIIFPVYTAEYGQAYLGGGPSITYSIGKYSTDEHHVSESFGTSSYSSSNNDKGYHAGVLIIGGIEAFITNNISMFAETHLNGGIIWRKSEWSSRSIDSSGFEQISNASEESDGWFYDATFIRLGVSLSF